MSELQTDLQRFQSGTLQTISNLTSQLRLGDLLYRVKGFVNHAGVYLGNGLVLHNTPDNGAVITSLVEYANNKPIYITYVEGIDIDLLNQRIDMVLSQYPCAYKLISNNCESIANFLISGRKFSPQIKASIIGAFISSLAVYLSTKDIKWALAGAAVGGVIGVLINNLIVTENADEILVIVNDHESYGNSYVNLDELNLCLL